MFATAVPSSGAASSITSSVRSATSGQYVATQAASSPPWLCPTIAMSRPERVAASRAAYATYSAESVNAPLARPGSRTVQTP